MPMNGGLTRRQALSGMIVCAGGLASGATARAQASYPERPVRIVSPYVPGGGADILARVLSEQLRNELGQPFIVENKPGAAGLLALEEVARAKPDGHTLMLGNVTTNTITPILHAKKLKFDYERAIAPVARLAEYPGFLLATKGFAPQSFSDMMTLGRQNPGTVRFGTPGVGSYPHFDMVLLERAAKIKFNHIPNPGGGAAVLKDIITGDAQIGIVNVVSAAAPVRAGSVRPLVLIYDRRLPEHPDVPTLAEAGYPGIGTISRLGLFTTGGTPDDVLEKLNAAVVKVLQSASVQETFRKIGMNANPTAGASAARAWLAEDMAAWRKIIADSGVKVD